MTLGSRDAGLTEAGRRREKHELAIALLRTAPATPEKRDLLGATDHWRKAADNPPIETSPRGAFSHDAPQPHRVADALEFVRTEFLVIEGSAGETMCQFWHHHGIGRGDSLNPRGQVHCLSDGHAFLRASLADHLADHHEAGGDPDPDLRTQWNGQLHRCDRVDQRKPSADGPLSIVLVGLRIAEIDKRSIAHKLGD